MLFVLTVTFSLISASLMATLFAMPAMQVSFAVKKSGTVKDGSGDSGLGSSGGSKGGGDVISPIAFS